MRPIELDNLAKKGYFKEAIRDQAELDQMFKVAQDQLKDSRNASINAHSRYMMAYEGLHSLAMMCLLHYELRPSDQAGHRTLALQKFCEILNLGGGMMKIVTDTHTRRNEATYRSAIPPLTHKDAEMVIKVLEKSLPLAESLIVTNTK